MEGKFKAVITLVVKQGDAGFADFTASYDNLPIEGVLAIEQAVTNLAQAMTDLGFATAPLQGANAQALEVVKKHFGKK